MLQDSERERNKPPIIQEEAVNHLLCHLDTYKSMRPDGIHPRVPRELAEEVASLHRLSAVLANRRGPRWLEDSRCNTHLQVGWKENPGNYRPVSLTLVPGNIMGQFILSALTGHVKDNQGIRPSQHGFMKSRPSLTNLISFYDQVTHLEDKGKALDVHRLVES